MEIIAGVAFFAEAFQPMFADVIVVGSIEMAVAMAGLLGGGRMTVGTAAAERAVAC